MRTDRMPFGAALLSMAIVASTPVLCRAGAADDARKKAERVTSYVTLAETITGVGLEVGGMLGKHPYDRALGIYARDLGKLHAKAIEKLTPPEGAEELHARFEAAVEAFAEAAEAHCNADYPTARKQREKSAQEFTKALAELVKMKRDGTIP